MESENFFIGTKLHNIADYSKKGVINLYFTDLSILETKDRIRKNLENCRTAFLSYKNSFNTKDTWIVKNLSLYKKVEFPVIDMKVHYKELVEKFQKFIEIYKIGSIPSENVSILEVFNTYYNNEPPFSKKDKKHEFPDAFILKSIEAWCKKKKTKIYVISKDSDFWEYKSENIIIEKDLSQVLDNISKYYNSTLQNQVIKRIEEIIELSKEELVENITPILKERVLILNETKSEILYKIKKVELKDYKILQIQKPKSDIELKYDISIEITVNSDSVDDYDMTPRTQIVEQKIVVPVEYELNYNYHHSNTIEALNQKWINGGREIILKYIETQ